MISKKLDSVSKYHSNRSDRVAHLAEHCASILKVVGSIPTAANHALQLARCGYRHGVNNNHKHQINKWLGSQIGCDCVAFI